MSHPKIARHRLTTATPRTALRAQTHWNTSGVLPNRWSTSGHWYHPFHAITDRPSLASLVLHPLPFGRYWQISIGYDTILELYQDMRRMFRAFYCVGFWRYSVGVCWEMIHICYSGN